MSQATPATATLHGRYRIEAKLGTGRLATVYRAYDERLQRLVLVHMLRTELLSQTALRQRFVEESHASARRSHQSLLEVFDSGEVAGRPYMITEYVEGRTIRELGALALEDALLYFRQVVGAIAVCQAAGVPHPPITSNNLILVADGHVELVESWLTPAAEVAADIAAYRAPERGAGQPVTTASAVYALGLLLFEMLTGRRAVSGDTPQALAQAHQTLRLPALSAVRPGLHFPSLDQLLLQATARDPSLRPHNAAALGQQFDELRRSVNSETQRLDPSLLPRRSLRERINRTAADVIAPRSPAPLPDPQPVESDPARPRVRQPPQPQPVPRNRQRSVSGIIVVLALFLVVGCGAYYLASIVAERLVAIELPRPNISLSLPNLGIEWPDWLTGVVRGNGEVLVVTAPEGLNIRAEPGLTTQVIGQLPNGAQVRKLADPQVVDNVPWVRVRAKVGDRELEGWVSNNFVKPQNG